MGRIGYNIINNVGIVGYHGNQVTPAIDINLSVDRTLKMLCNKMSPQENSLACHLIEPFECINPIPHLSFYSIYL